jgi:L-threonylcarbamoyladenylate synthase
VTAARIVRDLAEARQALMDGGVVAAPTDTVYGLVCFADCEAAVQRIFELKGRPAHQPLPVLIGGPEQVPELTVEPSAQVRRLMDAFWPGPLTIVVPARKEVSPVITAGSGTVGIRLPDHAALRALAVKPLASTSANIHGEQPVITAEEVLAAFGDSLTLVVGGPARGSGISSTVVDVTGDEPVIRRAGAVSAADIDAALRGPI